MTANLGNLKNEFYTGNYQTVINETTNPAFLGSLDNGGKLNAKVLLFRAYLAHSRYNLVIQDIKSTDPDVMIAIQLLAMYLASATRKDDIITQVEAISKQIPNPDGDLCLILATLFTIHGNYDEALKITNKCPRDLEWYVLLHTVLV
jgi:hypothetical protein